MDQPKPNLSRTSFPLDVRCLQSKKALVVGVNDYRGEFLRPLVACESDANSVYRTLKDKLHFQAELFLSPTNEELEDCIKKFSKTLKKGDIVLFYFAGHAGQFQGDNYLFGTDAELTQVNGKFQMRGCQLKNKILKWLSHECGECYFLIILDACRVDQQLDQEFIATRQVTSQNLDEMFDRTLLFPQQIYLDEYDLVFACQPGKFAIDVRDGQQGYMAEALCHCICQPVSWSDVVMNIKKRVVFRSGGRQRPQNLNNLLTQLYLAEKLVQTRGKSSFQSFRDACHIGDVLDMEIELQDTDFDANDCAEIDMVKILLYISNIVIFYNKSTESTSGSLEFQCAKKMVLNTGSFLRLKNVHFQNLSFVIKGSCDNTANIKGVEVKKGYLNVNGLHTLVADGTFVEESPGNGITITGCESVYLKQITAIDNKFNGIMLAGNRNIAVANMLVTDSGQLGLSITGTSEAKVKNLSVFGCVGVGVNLKEVSNYILQAAEIDGSENDRKKETPGIQIESSEGEINNVKIQSSSVGICLLGKSKLHHQKLNICNCKEFIRNSKDSLIFSR